VPQQRGGYHGDPVVSAERLAAGGHHDRVEQVVADALAKPPQVANVVIVDGAGELDDPPVCGA
jgi:hypothetical protein